MRTYAYPAKLDVAAAGDVTATFRDLPEAICGAETTEAARTLAAEALETAIRHRLVRGEDVPSPSSLVQGEVWVMLEPGIAARVALTAAMREQQVSQTALALRLGRSEHAVRRLLRGGKHVRLDGVLQALEALGRHTALTVQDG